MPGRYALIVATDEYKDAKLSRLRTPATDATELAGVLGDPEIGGFEVQLAANEPDHMLRRRIAAFFGDRRRDDLLLLHFSCHGLKDDSGQLYFATTDTEVAYLDASSVPAEFVSRQMALSRSNSVLMLLDCCYSGAIARGLRFRAGEQVDVEDHLGGHGRAIITASSAMEYAFEGDELTGEGRPSVFTAAVVKALSTGEADRDQDRWISVRELYDYVCDEVREVTPHQRPNLLSHLEGELYVARSRYFAPVTLPKDLLDALGNQLASVRIGAVAALEELLLGADRALSAAAREHLVAVAEHDDSRRVTAAARAALAHLEPPAAAAPEPPVAAVEEPPPVTSAPPVAAADESPAVAAPPIVDAAPATPSAPAEDAPARRRRPKRSGRPPVETGPPAPAPPVAATDVPPAAVAPPVAAAAATPSAPATEPPRRRPPPQRFVWLFAGGLLLASANRVHWLFNERLIYLSKNHGDGVIDKFQLTLVWLTGVAAVVLAVLAMRRPELRRRPEPWLALLLLAGAAAGAILGIYGVEGATDYSVGILFGEVGTAILLIASGAAARAAAWRAVLPRLPADLLALAGSLLTLVVFFHFRHVYNVSLPAWLTIVPCAVAVVLLAGRRLTVVKAGRVPGLVAAGAGAAAWGWVLYVDADPGLALALVGGALMIAGGLLGAGDPRQHHGVGPAAAEGEEGAQDALAREARRRQHA